MNFLKKSFISLLIASHLQAAPLIIGIIGGSGSGKTTLAENIKKDLEQKGFADNVTIVSQDWYYRDLSHLSKEKRAEQNFDAPESIDFQALKSDLKNLKKGKRIQAPQYSFVSHTRTSKTKTILPRDIIIVEGILLFTDPELRSLFDIRVFVDASPEERLLRRIKRDMEERGRTLTSIQKRYLSMVAPMYNHHVLPTKQYANLIIPNSSTNENTVALEILITSTRRHIDSCIKTDQL